MEEYDERTVVALADAAFNFIILRRTYTIKNPWYANTTGLDGVLTAPSVVFVWKQRTTDG